MEADLKELSRIQRWVNSFESVAKNPKVVSAAVQILGKALLVNFESEGSVGGRRWQNLTAYTQQIRRERGYSEAHPILEQSGELKAATVLPLAKWRLDDVARVTGGRLSATMTATISDGTFKATATGAKVQNHFGGSVSTSGGGTGRGKTKNFLPRRAFFYIMPGIMDDMTNAVAMRALKEWKTRGR